MKYLLLFLAIFYTPLAQAKINAAFEPKTVKQGSSVQLVLSSDTPFQGVPNLDVLEKDFVIGGQQKKQSAKWINGKGTTSYQLVYTLFPNKSGDITVKGLKVGSEALPDITLKVGGDANYEQKGQLSLSVHCPHEALYPSQKVLCQVTLTDSIGLIDGDLIPPNTSTGTWEQLIPLVPAEQQTAGRNTYQSVFAFTPSQSGKIDVSPFTFNGQVRLQTRPQSQSFSFIDLFILGIPSTATKPIMVQSNSLVLNVKEKPADYHGWWLPSPRVTLTEHYDMPASLHTGEPITRTITLFAQDVAAANLPVPTAPQASGFKTYANPEQRKDLQNGSALTVTFTFVPTQSGAQTLPAITIPWFNTQTEKIQQATLPTKDIFVIAEEGAADSTRASETPKAEPVQPTVSMPAASPEPNEQKQPVATGSTIPWITLSLAVGAAFIGGILVALLILRKRQGYNKNAKKKKPLPDLYPF